MPKFLIRIVAVLMIFCLVTSPVVAQSIIKSGASASIIGSEQIQFSRQALSSRVAAAFTSPDRLSIAVPIRLGAMALVLWGLHHLNLLTLFHSGQDALPMLGMVLPRRDFLRFRQGPFALEFPPPDWVQRKLDISTRGQWDLEANHRLRDLVERSSPENIARNLRNAIPSLTLDEWNAGWSYIDLHYAPGDNLVTQVGSLAEASGEKPGKVVARCLLDAFQLQPLSAQVERAPILIQNNPLQLSRRVILELLAAVAPLSRLLPNTLLSSQSEVGLNQIPLQLGPEARQLLEDAIIKFPSLKPLRRLPINLWDEFIRRVEPPVYSGRWKPTPIGLPVDAAQTEMRVRLIRKLPSLQEARAMAKTQNERMDWINAVTDGNSQWQGEMMGLSSPDRYTEANAAEIITDLSQFPADTWLAGFENRTLEAPFFRSPVYKFMKRLLLEAPIPANTSKESSSREIVPDGIPKPQEPIKITAELPRQLESHAAPVEVGLALDSSKAFARHPDLGSVFAVRDIADSLNEEQCERLIEGLADVHISSYFKGKQTLIAPARSEFRKMLKQREALYFLLSPAGRITGYAYAPEDAQGPEVSLFKIGTKSGDTTKGKGAFLLGSMIDRWKEKGIVKATWGITLPSAGFYYNFLTERVDYESRSGGMTAFPQTYGELTPQEREQQRKYLHGLQERQKTVEAALKNLSAGTYRLIYLTNSQVTYLLDQDGYWHPWSANEPAVSVDALLNPLVYDSLAVLMNSITNTEAIPPSKIPGKTRVHLTAAPVKPNLLSFNDTPPQMRRSDREGDDLPLPPAAPANREPPGGKWLWLRDVLSSWGWMSEEAYDRWAWLIENAISLGVGVLVAIPLYSVTGSFAAAIPRFLAGTGIVFLTGHLIDAVINIFSREYEWKKILAHNEIAAGILAVSALPLLSSLMSLEWRLGFAIGFFFAAHWMANILLEKAKEWSTQLWNLHNSLGLRVMEFLRKYPVVGLIISLEFIIIMILLIDLQVSLDQTQVMLNQILASLDRIPKGPDVPTWHFMIDEYVTDGIFALFAVMQLGLLSLGFLDTRRQNRYLDVFLSAMIPTALAGVYFAMRKGNASSIGGTLGLLSIISTLIFSLIQVMKGRMELTPRLKRSPRQRASVVRTFLRTSTILGGVLALGDLAFRWLSSGPISNVNLGPLDPVLRSFGGWLQMMSAVGLLWIGRWAAPWLTRLPKNNKTAAGLLGIGSALVVGGLMGNALATWTNAFVNHGGRGLLKGYFTSTLLVGPKATADLGDLMLWLGIDLLAKAAVLAWIDWRSIGGSNNEGPNAWGPGWIIRKLRIVYGQHIPEEVGALHSQELRLAA